MCLELVLKSRQDMGVNPLQREVLRWLVISGTRTRVFQIILTSLQPSQLLVGSSTCGGILSPQQAVSTYLPGLLTV